MARTFTAAPGLVKLMNQRPWSETRLPVVYRISPERLERLKVAIGHATNIAAV